MYEARHVQFEGPIVMKIARFAWEIPQLDAETKAYSWLQGQDFCPAFLGHVTEDGRVIGFIMEHISGARHADVEDIAEC